ncbi:hypothetical protein [Enterococcus camelliae]|uniref:Uncharacterized protein n=1 Tax=Enterococcus camelliae TaxID=453959 RepID=A0ABW5TKJ7_9ENTE
MKTLQQNPLYPKQSTITLYRGEASKSTPIQNSVSWTLDKNKANWFANRFDTVEKHLYSTEVKIDDILAYIDSSEKEVLVPYSKLKNIQELDVY